MQTILLASELFFSVPRHCLGLLARESWCSSLLFECKWTIQREELVMELSLLRYKVLLTTHHQFGIEYFAKVLFTN